MLVIMRSGVTSGYGLPGPGPVPRRSIVRYLSRERLGHPLVSAGDPLLSPACETRLSDSSDR